MRKGEDSLTCCDGMFMKCDGCLCSEEGESPLDKAIARLENVAARLEEKQSQKSETVAEGDAKAKPEEAKVEACTFAADETDLKEEVRMKLVECMKDGIESVATD